MCRVISVSYTHLDVYKRQRYYRPVFVITDGREGLKGSGRSIETYHMYEALHECEKLLLRYGGHKMAAGLSLEKKNLEALRRTLNETCRLTLSLIPI